LVQKSQRRKNVRIQPFRTRIPTATPLTTMCPFCNTCLKDCPGRPNQDDNAFRYRCSIYTLRELTLFLYCRSQSSSRFKYARNKNEGKRGTIID
jgi:hypothetical protein